MNWHQNVGCGVRVCKDRRTIAILACACANDVPVELTLVQGTLLFTLEDI